MKRSYLLAGVVCLVATLLLPTWSAAAEKIGFIDMRDIIVSSDEGRKAWEETKKIIEKSKNAIQEKETELKKLKDDIDKQRTILTEAALKDKESSYQKKLRDYQLMVKDANEEIDSRERDLQKALVPEILNIVKTIGEKEKYSMILEVSTMPIPYWSKDGDLTKRVTDEFNKTYKPKK